MNRSAPKKTHKSTVDRLRDWQLSKSETYRTYIKTSAIGLEFALSIVVGALLGYFADKYFASSPYGLLVGVLIGSVAATKVLWVFVRSYVKKHDSHDE